MKNEEKGIIKELHGNEDGKGTPNFDTLITYTV